MKFSEELEWRGFINQTTYPDISTLDGEPISLYFGVDPSAHGMQIGNLAAAMMVRRFADQGHKVFLLVGGATGMIGDPDGKLDERNLKSLDDIAKNKAEIARQYSELFASKPITIVDNYDWFKGINYLDFLREVGKNVPVSQMLGRDFIQTRLGEGGTGISYAEFSYALIQAYDFLHLRREHGVSLQLCGADQWGNSIAGVDLIRRIDGGEAHVLSQPLVMNASTGRKFGKSEEGAVWLDPKQTSVYKFFQFWLNVDDIGVESYLKVYTLLAREEIETLVASHLENPGLRLAQKKLAEEVTALVHGREAMESVKRVTAVLFGGDEFASLSTDDLDALTREIPVVAIGKTIVESLVEAGVAASNGEAKRLLSGGGVSINGQKITDDQPIDSASLLKKGKNSFILVR